MIQECTPTMLRIVYLLLGRHIQNDGKASRSLLHWISLIIGWIPACLIIAFLLFIPSDLGGEIRNNGRYEQFKYHYWGYSKVPTNTREAQSSGVADEPPHSQVINGVSKRPLRPRLLCLLLEGGIGILKVEDWEPEFGTLSYIFISYTASQFHSDEDKEELHRIAGAAAQKAGVDAYWIGCSCMPQDTLVQDVYRISDIVRGAHSVVVIVGPSLNSGPDATGMLHELGSRLWTFPEILLASSNHPISIYVRDCDSDSFRAVSKQDFAKEAWGDAPVSRQLIDHYEGSIILSPLELVSIALQCIPCRDTPKFYNGDLAYALMGLLRRRPNVDKDDSAFEAFCRLSLANDSDQLIERMICMLPEEPDQLWHDIKDFWGSQLWDIQPLCQVVGLGGDDTVILSGAFGAPIRWKSFEPVNLLMRSTLKRLIAKTIIRSTPLWLILGVALLASSQLRGGYYAPITAMGWVITGLYLLAILASPLFIYWLYVGKTWAAQPWLFGFEGYMEIGEIETLIFGINLGRLRWSPYSSELSKHQAEDDECVGQDPTHEPSTAEFASAAQNSEYGEMKLFTLVDTNTLTVTLFKAVRPPVAMILCGSEGGMQRALLCSYDWKTQTLYRESVLRVETLVLENMSRVDRFKLGLKRPKAKTTHTDSYVA
ncbi:unnamed protein product [Penicillium olsonii]|nr:unnamed protein product [Penicillium olsonii]